MTARRAEEDRMLVRLREADDGELIGYLSALLDDGMTRDELVLFVHHNAPPNVVVHRVVMALDALIRERKKETT